MSARFSVATIDSPEFLNISSINPLISKCEIKVLYVGENRNRSYISKEVATEMAATLPGTPIVGHFVEKKEDFGDHGQQIVIDDEGIKFNTLTVPYGFVAPDTKIWFQKFEDTDDFGNTVVREYLMTEGYLWTGQFEECKRVLECGNPQSMELDEKTLKGYWSEDINRGIEFFIINDAIFSKLCILGDDVEPCFEGANVSAPELSTKFSKDEGFNRTLYTMMQELNNALKGEPKMENEEIVIAEEIPVVETEISENSQDNVVEESTVEIEEIIEDTSEIVEESPVSEAEPETAVEFVAVGEAEAASESETAEVVEAEVEAPVADAEVEAPAEEFACKKDDDDKKSKYVDDKKDEEKEDEDKKEDSAEDEKSEEEDDDKKKEKYALLEQKYNDLEAKYAALDAEYQKVLEFKNQMEDAQKDELISTFDMLDEADKKDIVENKSQYSLDEIESKLSVIYSRKQRILAKQAAAEAKTNAEVETPTIYSVEEDLSIKPAWVDEVLNTQNSRN